jgi:hypothetical protein
LRSCLAGGDYVWQSRILGGGVGFVLAVTGWWFILWLWTPLYGDMLRKMIVVPILALLGQRDSALWVNSDTTAFFAASLITLAFVTVNYHRRHEALCHLPKVVVLDRQCRFVDGDWFAFSGDHAAFKAAFESNSTALFGTAAGLYDATVAAGDAAGAVNPLMGGDFKSISLLLPWIAFFLLYPNWGATLYGEVKGGRRLQA